jgi:hypothetical protein
MKGARAVHAKVRDRFLGVFRGHDVDDLSKVAGLKTQKARP